MLIRVHTLLDGAKGSKATPHPVGIPIAKDSTISLGKLFAKMENSIEKVVLTKKNDYPYDLKDWRVYVPTDSDTLDVMTSGSMPWMTPLIALLIMMALQMLMAILQMVLAPKPKTPSQAKKKPSAGIAGLQNAIEPGTPKFVVYGERRVAGTLIGCQAHVGPDGRRMDWDVLYFMGDTGGDGYEGISDIEINDAKMYNFPTLSADIRLGATVQSIIAGFEDTVMAYTDGRAIKSPVEIQNVIMEGIITGGTWQLKIHDLDIPLDGTTPDLAYNAQASDVQSALRTILGLEFVEVKDDGIIPNLTFTVKFVGVGGNIASMTSISNLTGTKPKITIDQTKKGTDDGGPPIVYTTKDQIDKVIIVFSSPSIFKVDGSAAKQIIKIEKKLHAAPDDDYAQISGVAKISILGTATGGTWTISVDSNDPDSEDVTFGGTTSSLVFNATAAAVQSALRALPGLGSLEVTLDTTNGSRDYTIKLLGLDFDAELTIKSKLSGTNVSTSVSTVMDGSPLFWKDKSSSTTYKQFEHTFDTKDQYDLRFSVTFTTNKGGSPVLFDVNEIQFTAETYPNSCLLKIGGLASAQITSIDSLKCTALVRGKKVKVWNGVSDVLQWTDKRMWILRDMLTHPKVGLGHRVKDSLFDLTQALAEQNYLDEMVAGFDDENGDPTTERRDICNYILGVQGRMPGWDLIREDVLGEISAILIPSAGKLKPIIDRPRTTGILYSYPGNIVEGQGGPVRHVIGRQNKKTTKIRFTYYDQDLNWKSNIYEYPDPDSADPDSGGEEDYQLDTVTRESQGIRLAAYRMKKMKIAHHYRWTSPLSAIASEPLDPVYLSYDIVKNLAGYQGFCYEPGTTTHIYLGKVITLLSSTTYDIVLYHTDTNITEKRTITTPAGEVAEIDVSSAFANAPAVKDHWAIGIQNNEIKEVQIENLSLEDDDKISMVASLIDSTVYDLPDLGQRTDTRKFPQGLLPPIPFADAAFSEDLVANPDGSVESVWTFDVTPTLKRIPGVARAGGSTSLIKLDTSTSPSRDGYFDAATFEVVRGTGLGQKRKILTYDGDDQTAIPDTPLTTNLDATSQYQITFEKFGTYDAFAVERADDGINFVEILRAIGTHAEMSGRGQRGGPTVFRFVPLAVGSIKNLRALISVDVVLNAGTSVTPPAPTTVLMNPYLKNVSVEIRTPKPLPTDYAGVEVELWNGGIGTGILMKSVRDGSVMDDGNSGTHTHRKAFEFGTQNYGITINARARNLNRSGNASAWVNAGSSVILNRVVTDDITVDNVSSRTVVINNSQVGFDNTGFTVLGNGAVTTLGGDILLIAKCVAQNISGSNRRLSFSLDRGNGVQTTPPGTKRALGIGNHIDDDDVDLRAGEDSPMICVGLDTNRPAGTYTYSFSAQGDGSSVAATKIKLIIAEVKR